MWIIVKISEVRLGHISQSWILAIFYARAVKIISSAMNPIWIWEGHQEIWFWICKNVFLCAEATFQAPTISEQQNSQR